MLPIPMQMLIASLGAMRARANVPIAMASCWVTNPFTFAPIAAIQISLGSWIRQFVNLELPFDNKGTITFLGITIQGSPADFIVGFLAAAVILSILAYPLVYGISAFIPSHSKARKSAKKPQ